MKQEKQKRTHIFSGSTFEELAGYSRAVVVGDHIYVSGTVGINFQTGKLPEDAAGQAEQALDTIETALHRPSPGCMMWCGSGSSSLHRIMSPQSVPF